MNDFEAVTPTMHLTDEGKKRGDPLTLQMRDYGLFVLGTGVDGVPLRARPAECAVRICENWFTQTRPRRHTYPL